MRCCPKCKRVGAGFPRPPSQCRCNAVAMPLQCRRSLEVTGRGKPAPTCSCRIFVAWLFSKNLATSSTRSFVQSFKLTYVSTARRSQTQTRAVDHAPAHRDQRDRISRATDARRLGRRLAALGAANGGATELLSRARGLRNRVATRKRIAMETAFRFAVSPRRLVASGFQYVVSQRVRRGRGRPTGQTQFSGVLSGLRRWRVVVFRGHASVFTCRTHRCQRRDFRRSGRVLGVANTLVDSDLSTADFPVSRARAAVSRRVDFDAIHRAILFKLERFELESSTRCSQCIAKQRRVDRAHRGLFHRRVLGLARQAVVEEECQKSKVKR